MSARMTWIIPWYRENDWAEWCSVCHFQGSFRNWLTRTKARARRQEQIGYRVAAVMIEPGKFVEWSRMNGDKIDHEARMDYAMALFRGDAVVSKSDPQP